MISSSPPTPHPLPYLRLSVLTNIAGSLIYKFLLVDPASYRLLSGPDRITDNMLCLRLTGAKAPSLLPLRLSYQPAPELVSRLAAAFWSASCHLSRTIPRRLENPPRRKAGACARRDSDRRTNVRAVTLQAGSLHLGSSEAHFKWHRELRSGAQNDTPPKGKRRDARTARLCVAFPLVFAQKPSRYSLAISATYFKLSRVL